jgi:hypothetical protein
MDDYIKDIETVKGDLGLYLGTVEDNVPSQCLHCSNRPDKSGSGFCHCILGTNVFY